MFEIRKGNAIGADVAEEGTRWVIDAISVAPPQHCAGCMYYSSPYGCSHVVRQHRPEECVRAGRPKVRFI